MKSTQKKKHYYQPEIQSLITTKSHRVEKSHYYHTIITNLIILDLTITWVYYGIHFVWYKKKSTLCNKHCKRYSYKKSRDVCSPFMFTAWKGFVTVRGYIYTKNEINYFFFDVLWLRYIEKRKKMIHTQVFHVHHMFTRTWKKDLRFLVSPWLSM